MLPMRGPYQHSIEWPGTLGTHTWFWKFSLPGNANAGWCLLANGAFPKRKEPLKLLQGKKRSSVPINSEIACDLDIFKTYWAKLPKNHLKYICLILPKAGFSTHFLLIFFPLGIGTDPGEHCASVMLMWFLETSRLVSAWGQWSCAGRQLLTSVPCEQWEGRLASMFQALQLRPSPSQVLFDH